MQILDELKPVHAESGSPLYVLVRDTVRAAIDAGAAKPGDRLPSTKVLSDTLNVSLVTVHRALQELVSAGVLRRGQGRGTFVHESYLEPDRKASDHRIGIVFHTESSLADSYHGLVLEGVRRRAHELGMDLVLLRYGEDWRNECQGYIYVNPFMEQLDHSPRFGGDADLSRPPTMLIGARSLRPGVSYVDTDNVSLARRGVEHLASLGHARIAYVGGQSDLSNNIDRFRGFEQACDELGIALDDELVVQHADWRLDDAAMARLRTMLRRDDAPTAIFAAGYYFALNVYSAATDLGLKIPTDLSVVGVDDPPSATHLSPPLTTMRQPLIDVGRRAADELHELMTKPAVDRYRRVTLEPELMIRGSTSGPSENSRVQTPITGATSHAS